MAIDFPSSPTDGQTFNNGFVTYRYNAVKAIWTAINYDNAPIGFTGSKGDIGFTGSQGPAGGFTGSQGLQGIQGFTGSAGSIGFVGSQSTNDALVRWDSTSGTIIQNSTAILDDNGNLTVSGNLNRGTDTVFARTTGTHVLTSTTAAQKLLGASVSANGRVQMGVGVWRFVCKFTVTGMSTTSGNASFSLAAGTAVLNGTHFAAYGFDNATVAGPSAISMTTTTSLATGANMVTAGPSTGMAVTIEGFFRVTTAGTVIPSIALATAAAATVGSGAVFYAERINDDTTTKGTWS